MLLIIKSSAYHTVIWFCIRKSLPKIRGLVRFSQAIKSLLNFIFPNSKEQFIRPKGVKLLSVADLTLMFHMTWILVDGKF